MVNFQCEGCVQVLKKKQVEPHFFMCRNSHHFSCLTCYKNFDRDTVKLHIDCITEHDKYHKNDKMTKGVGASISQVKVLVPCNLDQLKWGGFRKTCKKILMGSDNYKLPMTSLFEKISHVYAKFKNGEKDDVDVALVKKHTLSKLEDDDRFVIDLSKSTIRYKA